MSRHSRRTFLKGTAAGLATITIAGTKSSGNVLGANEAVRIGVVGIHGRGGDHIHGFSGVKGAQITYLVDPDSRLHKGRAAMVKKLCGNEPKCVEDIRKALEDKELDAISIATPNHWHSLATIWGCQAGKDVYVEKPCSHNIFEGRKCVEAARKYERIVQHGTQQRSSDGRGKEMAEIHAGKYGKLLVSKGYVCKPRWSIGFKPVTQPPKEVNYDLWLGPAPELPFHENRVHYNWHWFWDTGNGEIGNQGVHQVDVARWGIAGATLPTRVWSLGGRLGFKDQGETPNMQLAVFEFGDVLMVIEVRGLVGNKLEDYPPKVTNEFYTTEGIVEDGRFKAKAGGKASNAKVKSLPITPGAEFGSFVHCVRTRKQSEVNGEILEGHYSAALCHLANISYRLGKQVPFAQEPEGMDNAQVAESFTTMKKNLKAAGVDLDKTTYQMGRTLKFDPQTERFVGDEEANKYLSREYRKPYVVPDKV